MATTTTNFGWDIPQSTDLVKDGATAIAALGQDIDTAMVDLKGGTTGQVLAKASGTDLDFSWVAQDDSNAIQNAIVDAKGDLIAATAADTPARLAVGTNGQVLTADSAEATGMKWATAAASGGMTLLSTTTLSGTSTSITSIDQTYTDLVIRIFDPYINGSGGTNATLNSNSAAGTYQRFNATGDGSTASTFAGLSTTIFPFTSSLSSTSRKSFIEMVIPSYTDTTSNKVIKITNTIDDGSAYVVQINVTGFKSTTAVSSVQINTNATSWAGGTVKIYGVK